MILVWLFDGSEGVKRFLKRAIQFHLGWRWYFATVLVVALGALGQILIYGSLGNHFNLSLYLYQLPSLIPLIVLGPLSEEYGWRGYFLVKLQQKWNALVSSLVVGAVWGLWHLPLFFIIGTSQHELHLPIAAFLVGTACVSVLMTWVNNNTQNSIWAAILFHWLYTYTVQVNSTGIARSTSYNWLEIMPYLLMALVVVIVWGQKNLKHDGTKHRESNNCQYQLHKVNSIDTQPGELIR